MFDEQQLAPTKYDESGKPEGYRWEGVITGAMIASDQNAVTSMGLETESTGLRDETSAQDMNLYYGRQRDFIGVPITTSVKSEKAKEAILKEAKLDWPVFTSDGLTGNWSYANNRTPRQIYRLLPGKMVDKDGNQTEDLAQADHNTSVKKLFTTAVTSKWKPIQNEQLVGDIVAFCKESDTEILRMGTLADESRIFAVLNVGDSFVLRDEDRTTAKMIVTNTHTPGGLTFSLMAERMVCTNTLVNPVRLKSKKLTHATSVTSAQIQAVMRAVRDNFDCFHKGAEITSEVPGNLSLLGKQANYAEKLAKVRILALEKFGAKDSQGQPKRLADQPLWLREMLQHDQNLTASIVAIASVRETNRDQFADDTSFESLPQAYKDIMAIYEKETLMSSFQTVWGAFNGVTGHIDHFMHTRNGLAGHYQSAWFGTKGRAKVKAFEAAQQVAVAVMG